MDLNHSNRLVAEFMGARVEQHYPMNSKEGQDGWMFYFNKENVPPSLYMSHSSAGLKYNSSYDWLLPVKFKIDKLDLSERDPALQGLRGYIKEVVKVGHNINYLYNVIVDFIQAYNYYKDDEHQGRNTE